MNRAFSLLPVIVIAGIFLLGSGGYWYWQNSSEIIADGWVSGNSDGWFLIQSASQTSGTPLLFTNASTCSYESQGVTDACDSISVKWGYGDRVRIQGEMKGNLLRVGSLEILSSSDAENEAPQPESSSHKLTYTSEGIRAPRTVVFSYPFSQDREAPLLSFGDGDQARMSCTRSGCSATHVYTKEGTYEAELLGERSANATVAVAPMSGCGNDGWAGCSGGGTLDDPNAIEIKVPRSGTAWSPHSPHEVRWTSEYTQGTVYFYVRNVASGDTCMLGEAAVDAGSMSVTPRLGEACYPQGTLVSGEYSAFMTYSPEEGEGGGGSNSITLTLEPQCTYACSSIASINFTSPKQDQAQVSEKPVQLMWTSINAPADARVELSYASCDLAHGENCSASRIADNVGAVGQYNWQGPPGTWYVIAALRAGSGVGSYNIADTSIRISIGAPSQ